MLGLGLGITSQPVRETGHHGGALWTPLNLGAVVLPAWWSGDDHGTVRMTDAGAGLISSWSDQVGAMAITASAGARPTWAATSFNSAYAGLTFDGTANCLVSTVLTTLPTGTTAGYIFVVASNTEPTSGTRTLVRYGSGTAPADRGIQKVLLTSSRLRITDGTTALTDTAHAFDGPHMVLGGWSGTTESSQYDGADATPATTTMGSLATGTTRFRLGANNAGAAASFWLGVVRHCMVLTNPTAGDFLKLFGWAAHDSGLTSLLPVDHIYRNNPPTV